MPTKTPPELTPSHPLNQQGRRTRAMRTAFAVMGRVAPRATARVAEAIFVKTARPAPRPYEQEFLGAADRFTVRAAGQAIAGYRWGDPSAPAVLFAHGWWSHAGRFAPLARALLDAGFRGVAFDAPGHGRSSGWRASVVEFSAALRAVADHEGSMHAVIGHSLGGSAAIFATARGLDTRHVVTIAAPAELEAWAIRFRDAFRIPHPVFHRMRSNMERRLRHKWSELAIADLAASLDVRGLVLHDVHDPDVPWTDAQLLVEHWRNAELHTTERLGHRAILRDPAVLARVVEFLSRDVVAVGER